MLSPTTAKSSCLGLSLSGSLFEQGAKLLEYLLDDLQGDRTDEGSLSRPPVQTLDLIGQNHPCHRQVIRQRDLERIVLHLARDRTQQGETDSLVVGAG